MYETQERCYNMTRDVGDHGMAITPAENPCSCGQPKPVDRTYCFPCIDAMDEQDTRGPSLGV